MLLRRVRRVWEVVIAAPSCAAGTNANHLQHTSVLTTDRPTTFTVSNTRCISLLLNVSTSDVLRGFLPITPHHSRWYHSQSGLPIPSGSEMSGLLRVIDISFKACGFLSQLIMVRSAWYLSSCLSFGFLRYNRFTVAGLCGTIDSSWL